MPSRPPDDFFRYLAPTPEADIWGVVVTGAGRHLARPGTPYPPAGHPRDHQFTWERGRILGAFQVVYISAGQGVLETRAGEARPVTAGDAIVLAPGMWHRYRPDPATGWTELWAEIRGPVIDGLLRGHRLVSSDPVAAVSRRLEFEDRLKSIHRILGEEPVGHAPELAAHALGVLALLDAARRGHQSHNPIVAAVAQARRAMEEEEGHGKSMPELARTLGVTYSHFRREFRRRTGISPRQYLVRVRMQRVQRLLGSTDATLKQVADRLGFSSAFHLSTAFKAHFGVSPRQWRMRQG